MVQDEVWHDKQDACTCNKQQSGDNWNTKVYLNVSDSRTNPYTENILTQLTSLLFQCNNSFPTRVKFLDLYRPNYFILARSHFSSATNENFH